MVSFVPLRLLPVGILLVLLVRLWLTVLLIAPRESLGRKCRHTCREEEIMDMHIVLCRHHIGPVGRQYGVEGIDPPGCCDASGVVAPIPSSHDDYQVRMSGLCKWYFLSSTLPLLWPLLKRVGAYIGLLGAEIHIKSCV